MAKSSEHQKHAKVWKACGGGRAGKILNTAAVAKHIKLIKTKSIFGPQYRAKLGRSGEETATASIFGYFLLIFGYFSCSVFCVYFLVYLIFCGAFDFQFFLTDLSFETIS